MFAYLDVPTKGDKAVIDAALAYNETLRHYERVESATTTNLSTFSMIMKVVNKTTGKEEYVDVWQNAAKSQQDNMLADAERRIIRAEEAYRAIVEKTK